MNGVHPSIPDRLDQGLAPPQTFGDLPATVGVRVRMAASTRNCSATVRALESTARVADAGTVFVLVPALDMVGTTEVPTAGSPNWAMASAR